LRSLVPSSSYAAHRSSLKSVHRAANVKLFSKFPFPSCTRRATCHQIHIDTEEGTAKSVTFSLLRSRTKAKAFSVETLRARRTQRSPSTPVKPEEGNGPALSEPRVRHSRVDQISIDHLAVAPQRLLLGLHAWLKRFACSQIYAGLRASSCCACQYNSGYQHRRRMEPLLESLTKTIRT